MPTNKPEVVLPEPYIKGEFGKSDFYTADQLRAYGQACYDAGVLSAAPQQPPGTFPGVPVAVDHSLPPDTFRIAQQGGQEVVAYLTEDEVYGGTRRGLEFADCGTRRPGVSYYPLTHMHLQPAMPGIAWEAFSALEDVPFGEHASAKHFIRPYLQGGDVLGWRMVDGIRVFGIVPASGLLPRQDFVRYDDFLSATSTQPQQPGQEVGSHFPAMPLRVFDSGPWTWDENGQKFSGDDLDGAAYARYRDYMAGHEPQSQQLAEAVYLIKGDFDLWKEQTKAEHDWWDGKQNAPARRVLFTTQPPAIDIGKLRGAVETLNHAIATQLGARVTIHATRARQIRDELAALIGDGGEVGRPDA